jgi:iron complex outermembrane recepter protein
MALAQTAVNPPTEQPLDPQRAGQLSLEELMNLEVTSVAGVQQQVFQAPAAIDLITNEDVRRTGHRWLAEALRLSPGVYVGQNNNASWSVAPRGFNGGLANKTLVLMDGRRVYDPLQGGTFWDVQDTMLEDLDRIEVIRGPGPTLWGANAINGVVNIVNKNTKDTQGLYLMGGAGHPLERAFGAVRYGGKFNDDAHYALWATYKNRGPLEMAGPTDSDSEFDLSHLKFRTDIDGEDDLKLTFEADTYSSFGSRAAATIAIPSPNRATERRIFENDVRGGHILARAERFKAPNEGWSVLAYYDRTDRATTGFEVSRDSIEVDARYHFMLGERHALVTGVEYFWTADEAHSTDIILISPESETLNTVSAFVQDTITIRPDRWFAMGGAKVEHNDITGFEVQPSARVWWTPDDRQTLWGAVTRAVRTPSRFELGGALTFFYADPGVLAGNPPTGTILPFRFGGVTELDSEQAMVYEVGYRRELANRLTLDLAGYYNQYDDLISAPPALIGTTFNNEGKADTYGGELAVTWRAADNWRLRGSYSYTEINVRGPVFDNDEANTPHNMAQLRSYLDITDRVEFNAAAYFVDKVESQNASAYVRLDLGFTFQVTPNFDIAIWGQNLLEPRHNEFSALQVERGAYIMATLRF